MSIVEFDGPPSWCLDASETGESTKRPWVGVVEGTAGGKNRETFRPLTHGVTQLFYDLVPRAHVSFGQRQDTELWNNQLQSPRF